jgi:glycosyltransferase involved in cell wall biosynthesis
MARIAFVLPVRGGSGGAHSVVQEVTALRALGVEARVLVNRANAAQFASAYDRFDWVAEGGMGVFDGPKDLALLAAQTEVVIGTTNTSVHSIAEALQTMRNPTVRTGYYVQDYEPLFYAAGTSEHRLAVASFALLPNCAYFAKTSWLTGIVQAAHGLDAVRVVPSIDHGLYAPAPRTPGRRQVVAMVRPATPRRAPRRTLRLMARLAAGEFGDVDVVGFGADAEEMAAAGLPAPDGVRMLGRLRQQDVAALMREADVFLDLSDYQAFGRTAAEAMACGCVALAPSLGGAPDFITDGVSGFLVDTTNSDAVAAALRSILSLSESELRAMRYAGLEAVSGFTPVRAAMSEMRALGLA